jgi:circadian clock protein KaiC
LILNNQIALYKSTGQSFNLISFKLENSAQLRGLLTINQLQNIIRTSTNKKDKICIVGDKIIVLLVKSNLKTAIDLMTNVQNNLPSKEPNFVNAVVESISIYNLEIDERFNNAESMMEIVLTADATDPESYQSLTKYIG